MFRADSFDLLFLGPESDDLPDSDEEFLMEEEGDFDEPEPEPQPVQKKLVPREPSVRPNCTTQPTITEPPPGDLPILERINHTTVNEIVNSELLLVI